MDYIEEFINSEKPAIQELLIEIWKILLMTDDVQSRIVGFEEFFYDDINEVCENAGIKYYNSEAVNNIGHKLQFTSINALFNKLFPSEFACLSCSLLFYEERLSDGAYVTYIDEDHLIYADLMPWPKETEIEPFNKRIKILSKYLTKQHITKISVKDRCKIIENIQEIEDQLFVASMMHFRAADDLSFFL